MKFTVYYQGNTQFADVAFEKGSTTIELGCHGASGRGVLVGLLLNTILELTDNDIETAPGCKEKLARIAERLGVEW